MKRATESRDIDLKGKACDFLSSMRQNHKKTHSADLMKAKTHTYGPSFIYTHIPIYVSKDNYFYPTYFGQLWTHLFDRLY